MAAPHLQVGYVAKTHGVRGEVSVRTFDPASEALFEVERVLLKLREGGERELAIDGARTAGKDLLVTFQGIESIEDSKPLVGSTVLVFRDDLEPPAEGEYFQGDLIGLSAFDEAGAPLGKVEELWSTGEVPTLVIRGGAQELLVPFMDDFVPSVDVDQGRIVIRPPELTE